MKQPQIRRVGVTLLLMAIVVAGGAYYLRQLPPPRRQTQPANMETAGEETADPERAVQQSPIFSSERPVDPNSAPLPPPLPPMR